MDCYQNFYKPMQQLGIHKHSAKQIFLLLQIDGLQDVAEEKWSYLN